MVAVADVDALVALGSAIDDHARSNTTSVYTAARVFPMLPEKLSTDLTSLREGQERLAVVIEMTVDAKGQISASDVYRALVLNRAKLTYDAVAAWLDGNAPAPASLSSVAGLDRQLRIQDQAAQTLRRVRYERGALNFETVQARPVFNDGVLTDLRADERNRAKELIEDFMIASNGVVARYLQGKGRSLLRRVLRSPERWPRIVALAAERRRTSSVTARRARAQRIPCLTSQRRPCDVPRALTVRAQTPRLRRIRSRAAEPARRRSLRPGRQRVHAFDCAEPALSGSHHPAFAQGSAGWRIAPSTPTTNSASSPLTAPCKKRTRRKSSAKSARPRPRCLLINRIGQQFNGIVTGASEKGTWVRISEPIAEGKVVRGSAGLDVGDRVRVELVHVDPDRGFIDFARTR